MSSSMEAKSTTSTQMELSQLRLEYLLQPMELKDFKTISNSSNTQLPKLVVLNTESTTMELSLQPVEPSSQLMEQLDSKLTLLQPLSKPLK